jgi:hypothetical protein
MLAFRGQEVLVKKLYLYTLLSVVAAILLAASTPMGLSTLTIYNKIPGEVIHLRMNGIRYKEYYFLTVHSPTHKTGPVLKSDPWVRRARFTIRKDIYYVTIYLCDVQRSGNLNMVRSVRLVFPNCYSSKNSGEPTKEKVDVVNAIPGTANTDSAGMPGDGKDPWGKHTGANGDQIWWRLDWFNWWNNGSDILEPFFP